MRIKAINISVFLWSFLFLQTIVVLTFLATRNQEFIDFDTYLQVVKYSTLILLLITLSIFWNYKSRILEFNYIKYIFIFQILILYFTMLIHTDAKAINSPTILLMLISSVVIFISNVGINTVNVISILISYLNFGLVLLQITNIVPVAQDNVREGLNIIADRPTGILFNAFAMGYSSVITFAISAYFLRAKKLMIWNLLAVGSSLLSIVFSGTRTPLLLIGLIIILILMQNKTITKRNWKLISLVIPSLIVAFPLITVSLGNATGNQDMATLNGRTFLWECVTSKWQKFIPFGVGVQGAFPQGFCSNDEWFSKLRHPESMFLLNFVESGILGFLGLVLLFVISFYYAGKSLKQGSALPLTITATFFLSSIFYVPLFHYLPFLENRTADRGVFNFFIFTLLWMAIMSAFSSEKELQKPKKELLN